MLLQNSPRNELISSLVERLGVPKDSTFIFRTSSMDRAEGDYSKAEITKINKGTVVVVDEKNLSLVLAVRCNEFKEMSTKERERFSMGISTPFLHAKARLTNNLHKSIQLFILAMIWWGWMGCCGWRAGSDPGKKIGPYALKDFLPRKEKEIEADRKRMADFSKVRDFWADQFSSLCLEAFNNNLNLATEAKIPGFDHREWKRTSDGTVFASNLVVTCDGFQNEAHTDDHDYTRYSYGMFCIIDRETGVPHQVEGSEIRSEVRSGKFIIKHFGIEVDFAGCDGVVEMVWDTRVLHQTTPSLSYNPNGKRIHPKSCEITRFGSSCQISTSLVTRIRAIKSQENTMSNAEWEVYVNEQVKSYEDQFDTKFKKFAAAKAKREKRMKASTSKGAEKDVPHKRAGKAKNKSSRKSD